MVFWLIIVSLWESDWKTNGFPHSESTYLYKRYVYACNIGWGLTDNCEALFWKPPTTSYPDLYFCFNTMPGAIHILSLEGLWPQKHIVLPVLSYLSCGCWSCRSRGKAPRRCLNTGDFRWSWTSTWKQGSIKQQEIRALCWSRTHTTNETVCPQAKPGRH